MLAASAREFRSFEREEWTCACNMTWDDRPADADRCSDDLCGVSTCPDCVVMCCQCGKPFCRVHCSPSTDGLCCEACRREVDAIIAEDEAA